MFHRRELLRTVPVVVGGLAVPWLGGCGFRKQPLPAVVAERYPTPSQFNKPISDGLASALVKPTAGAVAPPQNILVLSGGGQFASYNAGTLVGWTAHGDRPTFDVVTGISSGAIVALFAFLGPKYDGELQRVLTTLKDKDIFAYNPIEVFRHGAIASAGRLEKFIAAQVTDEIMRDLCEAHTAGRRLYLGTMNVQTRRLVIWDLGALAACGRPDAKQLVGKVLQATGSIPGLLPAVKFVVDVDGQRFEEEHVDGGAASQTFLRLGPGGARPSETATGWLKGSKLYVMAAGKMYADPLTEKPGIVKRVASTLSAALYALFRAEATNMYAFCAASGMKFHMIAIPQDSEAPSNSFTFNPPDMRRLFGMAYSEAAKGIPWRFTPPGTVLGEEESPRLPGSIVGPAAK